MEPCILNLTDIVTSLHNLLLIKIWTHRTTALYIPTALKPRDLKDLDLDMVCMPSTLL